MDDKARESQKCENQFLWRQNFLVQKHEITIGSNQGIYIHWQQLHVETLITLM